MTPDLFSGTMNAYIAMMNRFHEETANFFQSMTESPYSLPDAAIPAVKMNIVIPYLFRYVWSFYQDIIEQHLGAPKLGLMREEIQQIADFIAVWHRSISSAGDFFHKFQMIFVASVDEFQKSVREEQIDNRGVEDLYNLAVSVFHEKYDEFLKSPEGLKSLTQMIDSYLEYRKGLNMTVENILKSFSIPTRREFGDIYRELYQLKKKSWEQDKIIASLEKIKQDE